MTQPKEKGGIPPIEIYTIVGPDPVEQQDDKNLDDEFERLEREQELKKKFKEPSPAIWP